MQSEQFQKQQEFITSLQVHHREQYKCTTCQVGSLTESSACIPVLWGIACASPLLLREKYCFVNKSGRQRIVLLYFSEVLSGSVCTAFCRTHATTLGQVAWSRMKSFWLTYWQVGSHNFLVWTVNHHCSRSARLMANVSLLRNFVNRSHCTVRFISGKTTQYRQNRDEESPIDLLRISYLK